MVPVGRGVIVIDKYQIIEIACISEIFSWANKFIGCPCALITADIVNHEPLMFVGVGAVRKIAFRKKPGIVAVVNSVSIGIVKQPDANWISFR